MNIRQYRPPRTIATPTRRPRRRQPPRPKTWPRSRARTCRRATGVSARSSSTAAIRRTISRPRPRDARASRRITAWGTTCALRVYPIRQELGSSRNFLGTYAERNTRWGSAMVSPAGRLNPPSRRRAAASPTGSSTLDIRIVTPRLGSADSSSMRGWSTATATTEPHVLHRRQRSSAGLSEQLLQRRRTRRLQLRISFSAHRRSFRVSSEALRSSTPGTRRTAWITCARSIRSGSDSAFCFRSSIDSSSAATSDSRSKRGATRGCAPSR